MRIYSERINIGIIEPDADFAAALAETISEYMPGSSVRIAESPKDFSAIGEIDVFLADSGMLYSSRSELTHIDPERVVALYDEDSEKPPGGLAYAKKYSGIAGIIAALRIRFAENSGRPVPPFADYEGMVNANIYSFFSTEGGAGTTSIAYAAARELSKYRGKRVFFISLEPYETTAFVTDCAYGMDYGAEKYLYYYLKGDTKILPRILETTSYTDNYGVMGFCPSVMKNKLGELGEPVLMNFLDHLALAIGLDCIVIDRGVWAGTAFENQRFIYVTKENSIKTFERSFEFAEVAGISIEQLRDMVRVKNMCADTYSNEIDNDAICISEDNSDFRKTDRGIELSLTNVFGCGVKKIVDALLGQNQESERIKL